MPGTDPIRHVVLLMLENHSFDQMLGALQGVKDVDGVPAPPATPRENLDPRGIPFRQLPTEECQMDLDPKHETRNVLAQIADGNAGFVRDFVQQYPHSSDADRQNVMGYYPLDFLPALHTLGRQFTVCDRWFSSLPGPTWPNRFFALAGTARGRVLMPEGIRHPALGTALFREDQDTIFDRLGERGRKWRIYYYDFPSSLLLVHQREPQNVIHYRSIKKFYRDVDDEASFPDFVFIEPKYFGADQNDDHPPHNVHKAEKLIADVYNAIRSSPIWSSTLLVVAYDEHGGFYDHVSPPPAVPPDEHREEYTFDRYGVRVPALLVSPWVADGVDHTVYDHTSLLKYLIDKWNLGPLGERTAQANSLARAIDQASPRAGTIPFIRVPYSELMPPRPDLEKEDTSNHHIALHAFAEDLAQRLPPGGVEGVPALAEPGLLAKGKFWLGKRLLRFGAGLTRELEQIRADRVKRTTELALRTLSGGEKASGATPPEARAT
jgi:phospholipase C